MLKKNKQQGQRHILYKKVAEYIFPKHPSQAPTYKEYGAGPVACFSSSPVGSWETFVIEHRPNLDLGGHEPADGFYDLNLESALYDLN